jgi:hypothetical protein
VPRAVMLIPTRGEGQIECFVDDADVGCTTLLHPCLTMLITIQAKRANAFSARPTPFGSMVRGTLAVVVVVVAVAVVVVVVV